MSDERHAATFEQLPRTIPIFPLTGALLLPGARLPLHIFEPRYVQMTRDAMAGGRVIGMVQPQDPESRVARPTTYNTGCAGRITACAETKDGRYFITLTGLCRFDIVEELPTTTLYRQVVASFARYRRDLEGEAQARIDRNRLLMSLKGYLHIHEIPVDWKAIEEASGDALVNSLCMVCPFSPSEKQALLEAADLSERARVMTALMEMALLQRAAGGGDDRTTLN